MNGLAITIIVGQLPKLFGFSTDADGFLDEVRAVRRQPRRDGRDDAARRASACWPCCSCSRGDTRLPGGARRGGRRHRRLGGPRLADHGVATVGALPQGLPTPSLPWTCRRRRPAAHRGGGHHARLAHRHHRHRVELRRPARRRGRARPGDGRHGRGQRRRRALPGLRRVDQRLTNRGGRPVGRQEPGHRPGRGRRWSRCSCCS